jgi:hypothetical protein
MMGWDCGDSSEGAPQQRKRACMAAKIAHSTPPLPAVSRCTRPSDNALNTHSA